MRPRGLHTPLGALLAALVVGCPAQKSPTAAPAAPAPPGPHVGPYTLEDALVGLPGAGPLMVRLDTSIGTVVARLHEERAPLTVANFVGLARGLRPWQDPKTGAWVKRPFYDGLLVHRVVPGFMVHTGCPIGDGTGGPGYRFADEFHDGLLHDRPGVLSMANEGPLDPLTKTPGTNGSQFFITERPAPQLDGRHSVFGEVVEGLEVVRKMARAPRDEAKERPTEPIVLERVEVFRATEPGEDAG